MSVYSRIRSFQYIGALMSLSLIVAGCSMFSGEAKVHKNAKGSIYLKEIADWSFEASHPVTIDQTTMLKVVKGVVADNAMNMKMSANMPASGSKPMRVFSDEDAEFLAPLLAQGLSQAKPEQIVGFKVSSSAGSGAEPTAGTLYVHKGSIYLTLAPTQNKKASGFTPSSVARLEKAPSFVALGDGAMTMVIDYQSVAKGPMPGSLTVAGTPKPMPVSASPAAPPTPTAMPAPNAHTVKAPSPQEASSDAQDLPMNSSVASGAPELTTEELLNRKLDELREAREANKIKDSEIVMLKKEASWMKQELRQRAEEAKAMKASKTAARPVPKKKSAAAYPLR
jgi:hypothetical protein